MRSQSAGKARRSARGRAASQPPFPRRASLEALEPRLLLSADLPVTLEPADFQLLHAAPVDAAHAETPWGQGDPYPAARARALPPSAIGQPLDLYAFNSLANAERARTAVQSQSAEAPTGRRELVIVDAAVEDTQTLLQGLGATAVRDVEIIFLHPAGDGIAQISAILAEQQGLDALHLISHGNERGLALGDAWLTSDTIARHADEIAAWGNALGADADLLLYGCDLAASADGRALLETLARVTGADVAASIDLTGHAALGGDWDLEYRLGAIETSLAVAPSQQAQWRDVLITIAHESFDYGSGLGGLNGQNGGTGWAGVWSNVGNDTETTGSSFSDPGGTLPDAGGSLRLSTPLSGSVIQTRDLSTTLGADGTTAWFSFVLEPDALGVGDFAGLEFGSSAVIAGYSGGSFFMENAGGGGTVWGDPAVSGTSAWLVVKAEFAAGNDTLSLYLNPTPGGLTPDTPAAAVKSDRDLGSFSTIGIAGGLGLNDAIFDEIRIGEGFADLAAVTIADEFKAYTFDGSDGLLDWKNDWQEIGETNGAAGGQVSVEPRLGEQGLLLSSIDNKGAWRSADLSGASTVSLSFDWAMFNTESGDAVSLEISTDGGTVWVPIDTFDGPLNHSTMQSARYDISGYISADTRIKFETESGFSNSGAADEFFLDNVRIELDGSPIATQALWLATAQDVPSPSGAPGLDAWKQSQALKFAGANLSLGAGASTAGNFSTAFDLSAFGPNETINALHYIKRSFTVGSGAAGDMFTFQPGDLLITVKPGPGGSTFNGNSTSITVYKEDVFVFRPQAAGDYSGGEFYFLLDDPIGKEIRGLAVVESSSGVSVGDAPPLLQGTFVLSQSGIGEHQQVYTYLAATIGEANTSSALGKQVFIDGDDTGNLGFTDQVQGIHLIESNISVGGLDFLAGDLLLTLNQDYLGPGGGIGATDQAVYQHDVFRLRLTETVQGPSGRSTAVADVVFAGASVGLDSNAEDLDALTLVGGITIKNNAPTLTAFAGTVEVSVEDTAVEITFAELGAAGNEADSDGIVDAFVVKSVTSGSVRIGTDLASAAAWAAGSNDLVDIGKHIYWTPAADANGTLDAFQVVARDNDSAESAGAIVAQVQVDPVNDAPVLGNAVLGAVPVNTTDPPGQIIADLFSGQFVDIDAGASLAGIAVIANTANPVTEGVWQYSSDAGANWFAVGTVADDSTALAIADTSRLRFVPAPGFAGQSPALVVRGLDNSYLAGFSTTAGASEARVTVDTGSPGGVSPISAASATVSTSITPFVGILEGLWLSTGGDVVNGGMPGLENWADADLVQMGAPDLLLEPAGTSGTVYMAFDTSLFSATADLNSTHLVSRDIEVGSSRFQLKAGDLLLSTVTPATFTSTSTVLPAGFTNFLNVNASDVFVFRPDVPGDYTAGAFALLLENLAGIGNDVKGLSLIERSVDVGDTKLQAGDFLFLSTQSGRDNDVLLFETGDVGAGSTSGLTKVLLEGNDAGISIGSIALDLYALDIVETTTTVGGETFAAGTILLSVDWAQGVGGNNLPVTAYDLFALNVTKTSLVAGLGNGIATASRVFNGGEVGFGAPGEELRSLTLTTASNSAPDLTPASTNFADITEDEIDNAGQSVASILGASVLDADGDSVGIAVFGALDGKGTWQYSIDGGSSWLSVGAVDSSNALLLADTDWLRFVPDGKTADYAEIKYRAWDQSLGRTAGSKVDLGTLRDTGSFSSATDIAAINVTAVNDAPIISIPGTAFINEIHYDNVGGDINEAVEIAARAGTDLSGWSLVFYSGFAGTVYHTEALGGIVPDQDDGFGTVNVPVSGIQNAGSAADGIALVDGSGEVLQLLSYEGSFTATDGPAAGMNSTDIGVAEDGTTLTTHSVQLTGSGKDFSWAKPTASTFGAVNTGQDFAALAALQTQSVAEDGTLVFSVAAGNALSVDDVDAAEGSVVDPLHIALSVGNGTLTLGSITGLTGLAGDGTALVSFEGSVDEINAALDGLQYRPNPDFMGEANLKIFLDDQGNTGAGGALTDKGQINITVTPVGDTPVAASVSTPEDTQSGLIVLDRNASDGAEVTHFKIGGISNGTLFLADGTTPVTEGAYITVAQGQAGLRFTPSFNSTTAGSFDVQSSQNGTTVAAQSAKATATITVTEVNDTPQRTAGAVENLVVGEDSGTTGLGLGLLAYGNGGGADEAGQRLSYAVTAVPPSTLGDIMLADGSTVVAPGSYTLAHIQGMQFKAAANASGGPASFSFSVSDNGTTDSAADPQSLVESLTITVTEVNDAPQRTAGSVANLQVSEDSGTTALGLGLLAYGAGGGADEAGQNLSYAVTAVPAAALGDLVLADGSTVVAPGSYTLAQIQGMQFKAAANASGGPASFSFSVTDDGTTDSVADPQSLVESLTITVTEVNDAPQRTAGAVSNLVVSEDSGTTGLGLGLLVYGAGGGADEAGQSLSYAVTAVPAAALGDLVLADGSTVVAPGSYTLAQIQGMQFKAAANANGGPASFSFSVTDDGTTDSVADPQSLVESLTITVTEVNDAPQRTAGAVSDLVVSEDSGTTALGLGLLAYGAGGGADEAGQNLSYAVTAVPAAALGDLVLADGSTVVAPGSYTLAQIQGMQFKAAANASGGPASFSFSVSDDGTTDSVADPQSLVESLTITVTEVNDAPQRTAGAVSNLVVSEDSGTTGLGLGLLVYGPGGGADEAGQSLSYAVTAVPAAALGDLVLADGSTVVAPGSYTLAHIQGMQFKAAANASGGPASFSFSVSDNGTTDSAADPQSLVESLTITVTEVNDAPQRTAGSVADLVVSEDSGTTALGLGLLAYGAGGGADEAGQSLSYAVTAVPAAALGDLVLADGSTVVAPGSYTLAQIQGMQFKAAANANGGPASFSFSVTDDGTTDSVADPQSLMASLTITVTEVNDAPQRTAGAVSNLVVSEDSGTTALGLGLLAYGAGGGADEAGQSLSYAVTAVPAAALGDIVLADGSTVAAPGSYTLAQIQGMQFKAAANANGGPASFSFSVTDDGTTDSVADPQSLVESLTITVTEVNDAPQRTAGAVSNLVVSEDSGTTALGLGLLAYGAGGGADEAGQSLSYAVTAVPAAALGDIVLADGSTVAAPGSYTVAQIQGMQFKAAANASGGPASFSFSVTDDGSTNGIADPRALTETLDISVTPVGDTPLAASVTTAEDTQSGLIVLARNPDDGGEVTHFKISGIANGTLTFADGITAVTEGSFVSVPQGQAGLRFTPTPGSTATGSFSVESSEDAATVAAQSGAAISIVTVTQAVVTPNDPPAPDPEPTVVAAEAALAVDPNPVPAPAAAEAPPATQQVVLELVSPLSAEPILVAAVPAEAEQRIEAPQAPVESASPERAKTQSVEKLQSTAEMLNALAWLWSTELPDQADTISDSRTVSQDSVVAATLSRQFREGLDEVREELVEQSMHAQLVLGAKVAMTTGLSAGYVAWLLRGGMLLSSVLSSIPMWRLIDPLPVFAFMDKDRAAANEEDESLDALIERGERLAEKRRGVPATPSPSDTA